MKSFGCTNSFITPTTWFQKFSMAILATLPLLAWYKIPFPVSLGYALVLFLGVYSIARVHFKISVVPSAFWIVFTYICFIWIYNHDFSIWTLFPPGGWFFFIFVLAILWGVLSFDLGLLKKYMRYVVLISIALFWVQICLKVATGSQIFCFVPNLTGTFTYEGLSYPELVAHQLAGERPCSIFMEPSYFAYYLVTYLAIVWFDGTEQKKRLNKEIIIIIISLIALKSGSGMIALAILSAVKMFSMLWAANTERRVLLILLLIPIVIFVVSIYMGSEMGQTMLSRSNEFSTEGTSGFTRVVGGYLMFGQLDFKEQLIGIPDASERFGTLRYDGRLIFFANGIQTILLSLGYLGALFYFIFYATLFKKTDLTSRMCIIILLVLSLIESDYLNPYMMLLTIIPCANHHTNKRTVSPCFCNKC